MPYRAAHTTRPPDAMLPARLLLLLLASLAIASATIRCGRAAHGGQQKEPGKVGAGGGTARPWAPHLGIPLMSTLKSPPAPSMQSNLRE